MKTTNRRQSITCIICIVIICLGAFALSANGQPPAEGKMDKDIVALSKAKRFEGKAIGEGAPSATYKLFKNLEGRISTLPTGDLMWLTAHGTAASRIYSALLTRSKDPKAGSHLLMELLDDDSPVELQDGCEVMTSSVSDIGSKFVATGSFMNYEDAKGMKPVYFEQLLTAEQFADHIGGEGGRYLEFMIFRAALKNVKQLKREDLDLLRKKATPAGRLYAASLLEAGGFEPRARALAPLLADKSKVRYMSGCTGIDAKVDEVAQKIKDTGKFINFDVKAVE
ncbi:MAG: hypothetical protein K2X93_25840 [Candidatus Obscuribacterales bacterium]|nr:hypothetical protein [Candidatus Obscuribacterales bacterium]